MSIIVEHITKTYGSQTAVNNVSFTIPKGETCGFLGPNGAGKSTTFKMITGFLIPDSGSIKIQGIDVEENPLQAKQEIGYLAEHNPLYKNMYVKEFLHFVATIHQLKNKKEHIARVIEQTGITKESHKLIGQLSKGFQQRVGLAQALIHNPSVLILDEPLSGLDPNQLGELRELVRELGKEKTVIFSSHILQEVEQVANRVLVIRDGELVVDQQIGNQTNQLFTILQFEEELDASVRTILNEIATVTKQDQLYLVQGGGDEFRKKLFRFAVENKLTLLRLEEKQEDLTTLFKQKTAKQ